MKDSKLTSGPVGRTLFTMTMGMLVGHVTMTIFHLTDTYFVSKLGTSELAAMSFTFPLIMLVNHFMFGLGMGTSAVISKAIGEKSFDKVRRYTTDCFLLVITVGLLLSSLGLIFQKMIFSSLGASGYTLKLVLSYMTIWFLGFPIGAIPMVLNNAIRATGDTKTPGFIMAGVSIVNMILDPLFIFGIWFFPAMGIKGAAVATIISRIISTTIAFSYMHFKMKMFDSKIPKFKVVMDSWKKILSLGLPTSFSLMLTPISMAIITRIISAYGDQAVAAAGAGGRIDMLALMVIFALSSVLLPFTGQNFGAGKISRIKKALDKANIFSFGWGLVMLTVFFFFKYHIAGLFSVDPVVIDYINIYLLFIAVAYPAIGVAIMSANVLNGLHKPVMTAALNFFRTIILAIPVTFAGGVIAGPKGIFAGIAFSNLFASLFYSYYARKQLKLEAK